MEGYSYMLLRSVLALGFVVALMVGAMYAFRVLSGRRGYSSASLPIRVIARAFMGQKSSIAIVDVAGEVLVLGISANAVNLLTRLDDPEVIRGLKDRPSRGGPGLKGLMTLMGRGVLKGRDREAGR